MNAIAFSIFGNSPKYVQGAIRNAELAPRFYPGWKLFYYVDDTVPRDAKRRLSELGATVREADKRRCPDGTSWRFLVHDEPGVERFLIRDADSRFSDREKIAVDQWLASSCIWHVIRDHPHHKVTLLASTIAGVRGCLGNDSMTDLFKQWRWAEKRWYGEDQDFLAKVVWPRIRHNVMQHDFCFGSMFGNTIPFPAKFGDWRFCSEVYDAQDRPRDFDWEMRINWMTPL